MTLSSWVLQRINNLKGGTGHPAIKNLYFLLLPVLLFIRLYQIPMHDLLGQPAWVYKRLPKFIYFYLSERTMPSTID